jgi:hypothetical protein
VIAAELLGLIGFELKGKRAFTSSSQVGKGECVPRSMIHCALLPPPYHTTFFSQYNSIPPATQFRQLIFYSLQSNTNALRDSTTTQKSPTPSLTMGNVISGHAWYHQVINPYTTLGNLPLEVRNLVYDHVLTNAKYIDRRIDVDDYRRWTPMFISQYFPVVFRSSAAFSAEIILVALRLNILVVRTHFADQALTKFLDCTFEKKGWVSVREVHVPRFSSFEEYDPTAAFALVKKLTGLKRLTLTFNAERPRLVENQTVPLDIADFVTENKLKKLFTLKKLDKVTIEFLDTVRAWDRDGSEVPMACTLWSRQGMYDVVAWLRSEFQKRRMHVEVEGKWSSEDCRSGRRGKYVRLGLEEIKRLRKERPERGGSTGV